MVLVISEKEVKNAFKALPIGKSIISGDISEKIIEQHAHLFSRKPTDVFKESIKMHKFPNILNKAEIAPVLKRMT